MLRNPKGDDQEMLIAVLALAIVALTFVSVANPNGLVGTNVTAVQTFGNALYQQLSSVANGSTSVEGWRQVSVPPAVGQVSFAGKQLSITYSGLLGDPAIQVYDMRSLSFSGFALHGSFVPGATCEVRVSSEGNGTVLVQVNAST